MDKSATRALFAYAIHCLGNLYLFAAFKPTSSLFQVFTVIPELQGLANHKSSCVSDYISLNFEVGKIAFIQLFILE